MSQFSGALTVVGSWACGLQGVVESWRLFGDEPHVGTVRNIVMSQRVDTSELPVHPCHVILVLEDRVAIGRMPLWKKENKCILKRYPKYVGHFSGLNVLIW